MKILSIDVGMKNLGICLFNITDDMDYEIILWDVLDLCNEKKYMCIGEKKDKTPCNKKAKFCKGKEYYCKIHAKDRKYKIPSQDLNIKKVRPTDSALDLRIKFSRNFFQSKTLLSSTIMEYPK